VRDKTERDKEFQEKFADFDPDYLKRARPPGHFAPRAGDKIWINRSHVTLRPNKELSSENVEVIDVVGTAAPKPPPDN
jgi:hypothetical protein